jgi:hypothetical protein
MLFQELPSISASPILQDARGRRVKARARKVLPASQEHLQLAQQTEGSLKGNR